MRTPFVRAALLVALAIPVALAPAEPSTAEPLIAVPAVVRPAGVEVTLGADRATVQVGEKLTVRARITNPGTGPTEPLVAHLNVATLDNRVYVDLEDWTASPTREVAPLAPSGDTVAEWEIQAVNVGDFDVYVAVVPNGPASAGRGPVVASSPELVRVVERRTLSPQGALPVAIAVPLLLGLATAAVRYRPRRLR